MAAMRSILLQPSVRCIRFTWDLLHRCARRKCARNSTRHIAIGTQPTLFLELTTDGQTVGECATAAGQNAMAAVAAATIERYGAWMSSLAANMPSISHNRLDAAACCNVPRLCAAIAAGAITAAIDTQGRTALVAVAEQPQHPDARECALMLLASGADPMQPLPTPRAHLTVLDALCQPAFGIDVLDAAAKQGAIFSRVCPVCLLLEQHTTIDFMLTIHAKHRLNLSTR